MAAAADFKNIVNLHLKFSSFRNLPNGVKVGEALQSLYDAQIELILPFL
jgi:hypothetical protein